MNEITRIVDQLQRAYDGESWAGPSMRSVLGDVTATQAVAKPVPDSHNIAEVVGHIAAWEEVAVRHLGGEVIPDLPPQENFPPLAAADQTLWHERLGDLQKAHEQLRDALRGLTDTDLEKPVPGKNFSVYVLLHGVVQHNVYHTGQIALLKKAFHDRAKLAR
jgi:uncharacterized damage-inducible protein DinB